MPTNQTAEAAQAPLIGASTGLTAGASPVICSPHVEPTRHYQLDADNRPTSTLVPGRRPSINVIPIPRAEQVEKHAKGQIQMRDLIQDEREKTALNRINRLRRLVGDWRALPIENRGVTPTTGYLLRHWENQNGEMRHRPLFFCQLEAIQTLIWLKEVAPKHAEGQQILKALAQESGAMNDGMTRIASKIATGGGKTTVMAMIIAYHAANYHRSRASRAGVAGKRAAAKNAPEFVGRFLILCPGVTVRERLSVLIPANKESYYKGLVPDHLLKDVRKARVLVQNFHKFKPTSCGAFLSITKDGSVSAKAKRLLRRNLDAASASAAPEMETEQDAALRVCDPLLDEGVDLARQRILVINDEAHHCYLSKTEAGLMEADQHPQPPKKPAATLKIDPAEKAEGKKDRDHARVWMNGLGILKQTGLLAGVNDLTATPHYLRGQGYGEGSLFPWVVSDFGLIEAIESGIVKMPRFPVRDSNAAALVSRSIYAEVRDDLEALKKEFKNQDIPADRMPNQLVAAIHRMFGSYNAAHQAWQEGGMPIPPVMIAVCADTKISKLVFDYIAGYIGNEGEETEQLHEGVGDALSNIDRKDGRIAFPRTLLVDSKELESGESISDEFKKLAAKQVAAYQSAAAARKMDTADLIREAMNTVGQQGKLGEQIRCIVSVGMLTEGWDARNVTHILGLRAFSTQLLCEQVVGRALRRISYDIDDQTGLAQPEYAEIIGVPFAFVAESKAGKIRPPQPVTHVRAIPERRQYQIAVPVLAGYRQLSPHGKVEADFSNTEPLPITGDLAPSQTEMRAFVKGDQSELALKNLRAGITETFVIHKLAAGVAKKGFMTGPLESGEDAAGVPAVAPQRLMDLCGIARQWLRQKVQFGPGTGIHYFALPQILGSGVDSILAACRLKQYENADKIRAQFADSWPNGRSTQHINFTTTKPDHLIHPAEKSHVNYAVCDSGWEKGYCNLFEKDPRVRAYVRNDHLGLTIPYDYKEVNRQYLPDFVLHIDDGAGEHDLLRLVVEVKGLRDAQDRRKAEVAATQWIPSLKAHRRRWGRWAYIEIREPPFNDNGDMFAEVKKSRADLIGWMLANCVKSA